MSVNITFNNDTYERVVTYVSFRTTLVLESGTGTGTRRGRPITRKGVSGDVHPPKGHYRPYTTVELKVKIFNSSQFDTRKERHHWRKMGSGVSVNSQKGNGKDYHRRTPVTINKL